MTGEKQGLVFISCGQYTAREIKLGQDLAVAVDELTDFEGYFAQNQTSLAGLSQNVFSNLNRCSAFVAVMHRRGEVQTLHGKHTRASVWVEEEIAIAAFLQQAQNRNLQVAVYVQHSIKREGVRDQLHLNPVEFETEDGVLDDFRARLADGRFKPVRLPPPKDVDLQLGFKTISRNAVHVYRLEVTITNTGSEALKDYWIELEFPKAVLDSATIWGRVHSRDTGTHISSVRRGMTLVSTSFRGTQFQRCRLVTIWTTIFTVTGLIQLATKRLGASTWCEFPCRFTPAIDPPARTS